MGLLLHALSTDRPLLPLPAVHGGECRSGMAGTRHHVPSCVTAQNFKEHEQHTRTEEGTWDLGPRTLGYAALHPINGNTAHASAGVSETHADEAGPPPALAALASMGQFLPCKARMSLHVRMQGSDHTMQVCVQGACFRA